MRVMKVMKVWALRVMIIFQGYDTLGWMRVLVSMKLYEGVQYFDVYVSYEVCRGYESL